VVETLAYNQITVQIMSEKKAETKKEQCKKENEAYQKRLADSQKRSREIAPTKDRQKYGF
jgi:hypothetical protein